MATLFRRLRLLPLTVLAAVLVMSIRLGAVWEAISRPHAGDPLIASAQAAGAASAKGGGGPAAATPPAAAATPTPAPLPAPAPPARPATASAAAPDLTPSEIEVLQRLAQRREELARRAEALDRRESLLKAAEHRLDAKLAGLKELQATLERLIAEYKAQQDEQAQSLVKIYENMKPKDAARIFEELEMATLLGVADRMKERKLSALLAEMNPQRAKEVTEELARLRALPQAAGAADAARRP